MTVVFGGGGAFGFGFDRGVADGLIDAGVDLFTAPMLGTSAGAITAASLMTGQSFAEVTDVWAGVSAQFPSKWRSPIEKFTDRVFGDARPGEFPAELRTVATRLPRYKRVVMTPEHFSVSNMVAASCAIPPVVRTQVIDGVRYGDGGLVSAASADFAPDVAVMLLVTPLARPISGAIGRFNSAQAKRETKKWKQRAGGRVIHIVPTNEIAKMFGRTLRDVTNIDIGRQVYGPSRELGRRLGTDITTRVA